ncbi:Ig-like domain-containing protein [Candidatus Entotheonella palauensis]|uniref:Ig-like domain-containing protein n=1 Tax=Candidatus Entotheonella palauensis TaxID=93172 RepID=UPI000B801085
MQYTIGNDTDSDQNTSLVALLITPPDDGVLRLNTDGSFIYNPPAGFTGIETFTYRASDGQLRSAEATVTIVIQGTLWGSFSWGENQWGR